MCGSLPGVLQLSNMHGGQAKRPGKGVDVGLVEGEGALCEVRPTASSVLTASRVVRCLFFRPGAGRFTTRQQ